MLRIMLVDESVERSLGLRLMLERLGYEVVAEVSNPRKLYDAVSQHAPDTIIVDTESPSRDTLEHLCMITESCPRPIVMFAAGSGIAPFLGFVAARTGPGGCCARASPSCSAWSRTTWPCC